MRRAYERVIRNALAFPTKPAVVIFMVFPHVSEYTHSAESDMMVIAQHYQVPVISTRCCTLSALRMEEGPKGLHLAWSHSHSQVCLQGGVLPAHGRTARWLSCGWCS